MTNRLNQLKDKLNPSEKAWQGAGNAIFVLGIAFIAYFFVTVYARYFALQKLPAFFVTITVVVLMGLLIRWLAGLIVGLQARFQIALALFAAPVLLSAFPGERPTSLFAGALLLTFVALIGGGLAVLRESGFRWGDRRAAALAMVAGIAGILGGLFWIFSPKPDANPQLADFTLEDRTLELPDPGQQGEYEVLYLTYGSGDDVRRPEYGEDVDVLSRKVDGSKLIDNWDGLSGWLRTSYWGFGADELPLQARVWYPAGEGPFPVVLIVHGNHSMEDFSDPGYGWLGEYFASRGIILASVDENFINSSTSARVELFADRPGLKEENDARGWLLLEHLRQWRDWNSETGHLFEGRVDTDRFALIGHSRGGEAVGIAAAFNQLDRYPDDASVSFDFGFNLRGVIAIAPVYGQYQPRERPTFVQNVNYFTIHGDMDGDVQSFEGMAQYSRVRFTGSDFGFRAGLYVQGANHGQFNTGWGNRDIGLFSGWSLDYAGIMDGEAQRQVGRVYFGAFMEIVLNENDAYLPVFRDARYAARWLPDVFYINQYADTGDITLADFEDDLDPTTLKGGGEIHTENLSRWYETGNELKYDELDTHSVVFAWDERFRTATPRVRFKLPVPIAPGSLLFSLSASGGATLPASFDAGESPDDGDESDYLDWTIELVDATGNTASAPLSTDSPLYPLVNAVPRRAGFLDQTDPTEVLFRRFEIPISAFAGEDFDASLVTSIDFVFDKSKRGAIILDDLSMTPARDTE